MGQNERRHKQPTVPHVSLFSYTCILTLRPTATAASSALTCPAPHHSRHSLPPNSIKNYLSNRTLSSATKTLAAHASEALSGKQARPSHTARCPRSSLSWCWTSQCRAPCSRSTLRRCRLRPTRLQLRVLLLKLRRSFAR
jgi:hypothetical protein